MLAEIQSELYFILLAAIAIIAVLNPFGNLPQFLDMTEGLALNTRKDLFRKILYTAFAIVMVFLFSGSFIMNYLFKVDINHLRIAGGLLLIIISLKSLLISKKEGDFAHYQNLSKNELLNRSVVPMAFPMLVGPGTLSTITVISEESGLAITIFAIIGAFLFMLTLFHYATTIEHIIGKLILQVSSRIVLIFIMAMGVKMMITGFKFIFHLS
ncbi:MarC family protein [Helicobacter mesocricetorum]|uniref:MarC family protein n=1 Tax=Helicobacter mesocricetorum TaxID=87012 RepID=UPI000CF065A8|nr:MarC family protein [Helicobacter mesocricetorum]